MAEGLLIRADADERMGAGHVMRCLALAQAWLDSGRGPVKLVSSALPEVLGRRYVDEGAEVERVSPGSGDLRQTLQKSSAEWVILDGYHFGLEEQRQVKGERRGLLVVDDEGAIGRYVADLVVDPSLFAQERAYADRSPGTRLLLGPSYALLRRELRRASLAPPRTSSEPRVLVAFGGADPAGLSSVALQAFLGTKMEITLVVGPANPRAERLALEAGGMGNVRLRFDVQDMRELMDVADVALVAAGGTSLELAHGGVPQVVVVTAPNQAAVAKGLVERGVARSLGEAQLVTPADLRHAVVSLLADDASRAEMARRGRALIDGGGAERVVATMRAHDG